MMFKLAGFNWQIFFAHYPDFARSEDRSVRRAWWFLWHGDDHRFGQYQRCYRLCGLTLLGKVAATSTRGEEK